MTDADTVREQLEVLSHIPGTKRESKAIIAAFAALDRLEAERDKWRDAYRKEVEAFLELRSCNLGQAIARAEAAEAETARLKEAVARWRTSLAANPPAWAWIVDEMDAALGETTETTRRCVRCGRPTVALRDDGTCYEAACHEGETL